jgi:phytoene dehydrogenase-like protein
VTERGAYDAVVVGSGPNGLAAAVELARNGRSVVVLEAEESIGGGVRSAEITLPGFVHDLGSAVHPFGHASPFFRSLPLEEHGLRWVHPPVALAHPFDDGTAVLLEDAVEGTAAALGPDAGAYAGLVGPIVRDWDRLVGPLLGPPRPPRHPLALARFGLKAARSARGLAGGRLRGEKARGLFAGTAAHSFLPLERAPSAAFGLVFCALGHAGGWPFPEGSSQRLTDALSSYLRSLGGEVRAGVRVRSVAEVPKTRTVLFDVPPSRLLKIVGGRFSRPYRRALARYRHGPGVFKVDFALDAPIPWTARECSRAATVHLGGTFDEIAAGEAAVWRGEHPERPFVLLAQHTLFDPSRAPDGKHTAWAYCHVPNGSTFDMTGRIEAQIERFAPGFRERILAKAVSGPATLERQNTNLIGGDISGGVADFRQLVARPAFKPDPYATSVPWIFVCSSSTPPGGGVHGMCGYHAARSALRYLR